MNAPIEGYTIDALASIESEQAILGGLMLDNRLWDHVGDLLTPTDFFREEHQKIFTAIGQLINASKPADIVTVFERMGGETELSTLNSIASFVPGANNARQYAENVRQRALSRKMMAASTDIQQLALNHVQPFNERLEQATGFLSKLSNEAPSEDWADLQDSVVTFLDHVSDVHSGAKKVVCVRTGLKDLDEQLQGGLKPGQLVIIGARPSIGKSALAVTIGQNACLNDQCSGGMFSLEMSKEELVTRQVSMLSEIHLSVLSQPERMRDHDWPRLTHAVDQMRGINFHVAEQSGPNINQIRSKARILKRRHGLDFLIVDYIGLCSGLNPKENRNQQLGEVSRGLKNLAKELKIPVIALAQLNRKLEERTGGKPMLSDLKDSGDIEQDADVVIFIDRPYHNNKNLGPAWENYAELIVAKQRNGPTGSVNARYIGKNVQFLDWEGEKPARLGRSSGGDL